MDGRRGCGGRPPVPAAADRARAQLVRVCRRAFSPVLAGEGPSALRETDLTGLWVLLSLAMARVSLQGGESALAVVQPYAEHKLGYPCF